MRKSKSKLKIRKCPTRAFVRVSDTGATVDLDGDLVAVDDGALVYVAATTPPPHPASSSGAPGGWRGLEESRARVRPPFTSSPLSPLRNIQASKERESAAVARVKADASIPLMYGDGMSQR